MTHDTRAASRRRPVHELVAPPRQVRRLARSPGQNSPGDELSELAKQVAADYADADGGILLVCVLKGAVMFMADFARALGGHGPSTEMEFMAVSSYGSGTTSSEQPPAQLTGQVTG